VFAYHDLRTELLPWRVWAANEWAQGRVPLWCDGVGNGFPLAADGQTGAFYPLTMLLFLVLPPALALNWSILAHVWIAAFGTFLLARALGRSWEAALFAAIAFGFSGFLATHAHYLGMQNAVAWLPWALWALHGDRRATLTVTIFFLLVAGHIEAATFALAMVLACAIAWRRWNALFFGLGIGVLLAAPQLLATAELSRESLRAGGVTPAFAATGSLPVQEIVNGVLPKLFGFDRPADVRESYFQRGPSYWGQGTSHWEMAFTSACLSCSWRRRCSRSRGRRSSGGGSLRARSCSCSATTRRSGGSSGSSRADHFRFGAVLDRAHARDRDARGGGRRRRPRSRRTAATAGMRR
jgi:hypothetical protein